MNPEAEEILEDRCYADIKELPKRPDVVDFVVSPRVTERIPETCLKLGITKV